MNFKFWIKCYLITDIRLTNNVLFLKGIKLSRKQLTLGKLTTRNLITIHPIGIHK